MFFDFDALEAAEEAEERTKPEREEASSSARASQTPLEDDAARASGNVAKKAVEDRYDDGLSEVWPDDLPGGDDLASLECHLEELSTEEGRESVHFVGADEDHVLVWEVACTRVVARSRPSLDAAVVGILSQEELVFADEGAAPDDKWVKLYARHAFVLKDGRLRDPKLGQLLRPFAFPAAAVRGDQGPSVLCAMRDVWTRLQARPDFLRPSQIQKLRAAAKQALFTATTAASEASSSPAPSSASTPTMTSAAASSPSSPSSADSTPAPSASLTAPAGPASPPSSPSTPSPPPGVAAAASSSSASATSSPRRSPSPSEEVASKRGPPGRFDLTAFLREFEHEAPAGPASPPSSPSTPSPPPGVAAAASSSSASATSSPRRSPSPSEEGASKRGPPGRFDLTAFLREFEHEVAPLLLAAAAASSSSSGPRPNGASGANGVGLAAAPAGLAAPPAGAGVGSLGEGGAGGGGGRALVDHGGGLGRGFGGFGGGFGGGLGIGAAPGAFEGSGWSDGASRLRPLERPTPAVALELIEWLRSRVRPSKDDAHEILTQVQQLCEALPTLQQLKVPPGATLHVVGDLHGQLQDLLHILEMCGDPCRREFFLFNGDLVDRGDCSVEVALAVFSLKLAFPDLVHVNRGNHESLQMNFLYGFFDEVGRKYGKDMFKLFTKAFQSLPVATVVNDSIFVVHGGLSDFLDLRLADVAALQRGGEPSELDDLLCDLLWSDPFPGEGTMKSYRGCGVLFGSSVTEQFCRRNGLFCIIRSHEMKPEGYEWAHEGRCLTVFSASNYCGFCGNEGAVCDIRPRPGLAKLTATDLQLRPFMAAPLRAESA